MSSGSRNPQTPADQRADRVVRSWLHEDRHEDATRLLDAVLVEADTTPQRRSAMTAWRFPFMNNTLVRYGVTAAAVVIVALIGFQLIGGGTPGGPTPTSTPEPTSTPPADGSLPVGPGFVLWDGSNGDWSGTASSLGIRITVTIPAAGWFGETDGGVLTKNGSADAPDGAVVTVFARTNDLLVGLGDLYVYGDPCHWATTRPDTPVTTVDEAIAALSAQPSRDASTPEDVTYGSYAGQAITLHVPADAVFSNCDQGEFRTLIEGDGTPRSHEDPGQYDLFTVLDVKGELVIFDVAYYEGAPGTPQGVLDEMAQIVESAILEYNP
jgi:hypothetical protein